HRARCSRLNGREALPLASCGIEVRRVEPALVTTLQRGPVSVDDRVPRGVAVSLLVNRGLPEQTLILESQSQRRGTRGRVEGVAFPFITPVAELVEDASHHQEHCLGRRGGVLEWRGIIDVPDLDYARRRVDPQITGNTHGASGSQVADRVKERIVA